MNVLFFTYDFPYPSNSGGKMRAYNLLKYAGDGVSITLFSFVREGFDEKNLEEMKKIGIKDVYTFPRRRVKNVRNAVSVLSGSSIFKSLYYDPSIEKKLHEIITEKKIDLLHFESFYTACYLKAKPPSGVKQIYGSENIEHLLYREYVAQNVSPLFKPLYTSQVKRIEQEEETAARLADTTLAVTEKEKHYFESVSGKPAHVIENGVNIAEFSFRPRRKKDRTTMLFVGNFNYFPNKDAVEFVIKHVLQKLPDEKLGFSIIGKGSGQFAGRDPRIKTIEFIDDITDAYYDADIFVCPISIGGGTNFKLLEAMATGVPVVAFSDRVKEIGALHKKDVLTADTGDAFREAVVMLLSDKDMGEKLAKNARKIIEEKFAWEKIGARLNRVWKTL